MVIFTSISFCVVILGLVLYVVIDAVKMKPIPSSVSLTKDELDSSFRNLKAFTERIQIDLDTLKDEVKKKDLGDEALKPITDIAAELRLMRRRSTRSYLERLKEAEYYGSITVALPKKEGELTGKLSDELIFFGTKDRESWSDFVARTKKKLEKFVKSESGKAFHD